MTDLPSGISTTCIMTTPEGLTPLGWLKEGDLIETRDHGFQPIDRIDPMHNASSVQIDGVTGRVLAGQHLLACGWAVQMYFGVDQMLATASDVSPTCGRPSDQTFAQIFMASPMLLRVSDVWIESHGHTDALHPVLTRDEVRLTKHTFGCPLARDPIDMPMEPIADWPDVSTTFGSRSALA